MSSGDNPHVLNDLVEPLNRHLHIPLAGLMIPPLSRTSITPNQITYFSVVVGIVGAYEFSLGTLSGMMCGGLLLELSLILDCVDGQLARARNMSSEWGRILDGLGGYVSNLAIVFGIALGYPETRSGLLLLTVFTVFRAVAYDYCKQSVSHRYQEGIDWSAQEIQQNHRKLANGSSLVWKVYGGYLQLQRYLFHGRSLPVSSEGQKPSILSAEGRRRFFENNRGLFQLWKWNGPDLVFFLMALSAMVGHIHTFIWPLALLVTVQFFSIMLLHRIRYIDEATS